MDFDTMIHPITPPHLWMQFDQTGDADFAYQLGEAGRFRVNLFRKGFIQQLPRALLIRLVE